MTDTVALGAIERRLRELGLELPEPLVAPEGARFNFLLVNVWGNIAFVAGHGATDGSRILAEGRVGEDVTPEQAYEAARLTGLSILASLKRELGELDRVTRWLRATGYVNAVPGFKGNAGVVNGFSDLIVELWGDAGRHARSAPGAGSLPYNIPVVIEAMVEVA